MHSYLEKSEQCAHASVHEVRGLQEEAGGVFLLLSPGLATCRAGASTELLSQESPRTLQVSGRHVHITWRKHGLATRAGCGSVAQTVPGQKFSQLPGPPGPCVPCFVLLAIHPDSGSTN